jgi:hypothetical protein
MPILPPRRLLVGLLIIAGCSKVGERHRVGSTPATPAKPTVGLATLDRTVDELVSQAENEAKFLANSSIR